MIPDLNHPILYACVAHGATVLAELVPGGGGGGDVAAVARRCLAAAPPFHREYSHTAGGRIYAFAMADPLVLFAIADSSLGAPRAFLFLRRLRRSTARGGGAAAAPLSLQSELRRLALALPDEVDDPPPPSPSPSPPPTPPSPLNETNNEPLKTGTGEEEKKKRKKKKQKQQQQQQHPLDGGDGAMEISVAADAADPLPKSMRIAWRQHLRAILLIDLAVCGLLFGIWISVCKGFHCIRRIR
ncbi:phytolongin Phyl2.2-like isoform X2 [Ananas comosus]|uniref:Phytolongin Phyl2.2-like isoform X2 n=1 Tax=Ananas comosus TaxID=4615 RepID=A0A6P5FUC7_ANACO|nr:phytolongin Phyl2.2-like isoform X2 [Ananas comosus]